ncbi:uncharacterized protein PV07_00092 [Cladophialophora immunda]|uniref:Major facilitator superfamily (MFS) profile domain-containing protein n=1 Tax=Cladophialophora immunda TaxID=569365 RepID=A0A0D2CTH5_9EURO|nr:uncharacterized protein PV07_00092 [Cladophialophora immunda]KIW33225.1 hypothetical protein PV07_00092 [Cladophialophora immunda]
MKCDIDTKEKAPFGRILNDRDADRVPGAVILNEKAAHSEDLTTGLKHAKGHDGALVLIPEPANDPNDPLNWPQPKKLTVVVIISFGTILTAAVFGPLLNAGMVVLATELNVSISKKYGKRLLFNISTLFAAVSSIICGCASTYRTLHAGRVVQGFSIAAYESLCFVIIGDLFFVHERGLYAALTSRLLIVW